MLLSFILALTALILVHEFGHFVVAKALGIEIEEFGIGFPPRLVTLGEWKGTRFTINAIPLGGFVRPKTTGEDPEAPDALRLATPPKRILTLLAGPLANLLLAVVLMSLIYLREGIPQEKPVYIQFVHPGSPAEQAGLQPGDELVTINDTTVESLTDAHDLIYANLGRPIRIAIRREGHLLTLTATPRKNPPPNQGALGVLLTTPSRPVSLPEAAWLGTRTTAYFTYLLAWVPVGLLQGQLEPGVVTLQGYRGMYEMYSQAVQTDQMIGNSPAGTFSLFFYVQLTISLALLNLLPIPALDGGRILMALGEWVTRRSLPLQWEYAINLIGFVLILFLLIGVNLREWLP